MGLMSSSTLYIFDCLSGKLRASQGDLVSIGKSRDNTVRADMDADIAGSFSRKRNFYTFFPQRSIGAYTVNGTEQTASSELLPNKLYLFTAAMGCFICWYGDEDNMPNFSSYNLQAWYLYDKPNKAWHGPYAFRQLATASASLPKDCLATFEGLDRSAFYLKNLLPIISSRYPIAAASKKQKPAEANLPPIPPEAAVRQACEAVGCDVPDTAATRPMRSAHRHEPPSAAQSAPPAEQPARDIDPEHGELLCPVCWQRFTLADIMNIASHPDLRGDSLLGEDAMQRFWATSFNDKGQALDAKGVPCTDFACPHCRRRLPAFFLKLRQRIFSIVGAPSSGKSYYLAALLQQLEQSLPREYGLTFRDADPTCNAIINDMRKRLFSASSPEEAYLTKTDLEGALYETLPRHGRMTRLPKPFIYTISGIGSDESPTGLVFYDNAGEHFEPGRNSEDSPGAQHVAVADGLCFLFDPTVNPDFRRMLKDVNDPQLQNACRTIDQQSTILTEMEVRIKTLLNLAPQERIRTPFAFIIGKCDTWQHLLEGGPLLPASENGRILQHNIDANSERLRRFLFGLHPSICTTVEAISSDVRYFAASAFGTPPVEFTDTDNSTKRIGPDPAHLSPIHICDPTLWLLSRLEPTLIPSL